MTVIFEAVIIIALRFLLVPMALGSIYYGWSGVKRMWRGSSALSDQSGAGVFFFGVSSLVGQIFFLFWPQPEMLILALMCAVISHSLMIYVRWAARKQGLVDFDRVLAQLHVVLPMVEMAEDDPKEAEAFADMIRQARASRKVADV